MTANVVKVDGSSTASAIFGIDQLNSTSGEKIIAWVVGNSVFFGEANPAGLSAYDDGTYIVFKYGGTTYFKIRKSDGQFMVAGGYDSDVTL